jgi:urea transport system ATP-binding protein
MTAINGTPLLEVEHLTMRFGGLVAVNDVSFTAMKQQITAVIGPNGAGKTTMMDIVTGETRPDRGTVLFRESVDLTRRYEADIARLGIGRKFQKPTVFESHDVWTNLELALKGERALFRSLLFALSGEQRDRIEAVLGTIRLADAARRLAGELSHGQKQWLEIGMLLVQDPELLLVDEPVAGMTDAETEATGELLRGIAANHTVVVVEHDMEFVRGLGSKVTVLHEGSVLAEGPLEQVQNDQRVVEVYLGR